MATSTTAPSQEFINKCKDLVPSYSAPVTGCDSFILQSTTVGTPTKEYWVIGKYVTTSGTREFKGLGEITPGYPSYQEANASGGGFFNGLPPANDYNIILVSVISNSGTVTGFDPLAYVKNQISGVVTPLDGLCVKYFAS